METPQPHQLHHDLVQSVRVHVAPHAQTHRFSMLAKESIFKAQDMLYDVEDERLQKKLRRRLAKLRGDLEAFDREYRKGGGA